MAQVVLALPEGYLIMGRLSTVFPANGGFSMAVEGLSSGGGEQLRGG